MAQEWYNWELTQGNPESIFAAWTALQTVKPSMTFAEPEAKVKMP